MDNRRQSERYSEETLSGNPRTSANQSFNRSQVRPLSGQLAADHERPRKYPPPASVEDEAAALAREHNPSPTDPAAAESGEEPKHRGHIDQTPIILDAHVVENPERRFVLVPKSDGPATKDERSSSRPQKASRSDSSGNGSPDGRYEYEANTCRKFTVPRIDTDTPTAGKKSSGGYSGSSSANKGAPSAGAAGAGAGAGAAAAAATAAAAAIASAATSSREQPAIQRRRSRLDLPRIDTDMDDNRSSASYRPRSASFVDGKLADRIKHTRHESASRDNEFLSPSYTKHATKGRDRAYFDQESTHPPGVRARSGDSRTLPDDRKAQDRPKKDLLNVESPTRRRASSFNGGTEKPSRRPSVRKSSRERVPASARTSRVSLSPPAKDALSKSSMPRSGDKHDSSRERDWVRDRERDRDRDRVRDRDRDRDRARDRDRDHDRTRDRDRDRRDFDTDRDKVKLSRRDSTASKHHRSSVVLPLDDGQSSDERTRKGSSGPNGSSLRRKYSNRHKSTFRDDKSSTASSSTANVDLPSRHKSASITPLATPRHSQAHIPIALGAFALTSELLDTASSSPPKARGDERKRREARNRRSSSSDASLSPDSRPRFSAAEGERPRGPRPRGRQSNVIHNPSIVSDPPMSSHQQPSLQPSRAATLPKPIPHASPLPSPGSVPSSSISIPARSGSVREREGRRYERRRSPTDPLRDPRSSQLSNLARLSGNLGHSPNMSQPTQPPPAFYIDLSNPPGQPVERFPGPPPGRPAANNGSQRQDWSWSSERRPERALVPTYGQHAENVCLGKVPGLPDCPRQNFSFDYWDWRVLIPFSDFFICPTCYDAAFSGSPYGAEFVPAPAYTRDAKIRCTFGSLHWYKAALFLNSKLKLPSLTILRSLFEKDEQLRDFCYGPRPATGGWFTIQDPATGNPMPEFSVCRQCVTAISVLFPKLGDVFRKIYAHGNDLTDVCAMYYEPNRTRLWRYLDVLEAANEVAQVTRSPPDVEGIVNELLDITYTKECRRDEPVARRKWYSMRSLPEFTVCEECFDAFVYPKVGTYRVVAGDFFKEPKELPLASCHLYSPRMRDIFLEACQTNDKAFLELKLNERTRKAKEITSRLNRLPPVPLNVEDVESERLMEEWKKWE